MGELIRFPDDTQRLVIIGRTGTGKTLAALWHLSARSYLDMPWIIFDYKRDKALAALEADELALSAKTAPSKPGLYIVHPIPERDDAAVERLLWEIWSKGDVGIYVDEGYMIGASSEALRAILTQGRSKNIPVILLSQRPVWLTRFAWSEADFFQVFQLNSKDDIRSVRNFVPYDFEERLADFHSVYYDVGRDRLTHFQPVPDESAILSKFRVSRARPKSKSFRL
jgi:hypothetical protein